MPTADETRGDVYAIVSIGRISVISGYDQDGRNVTPDEFIANYRTYFKLAASRTVRFDTPSKSGCRLFMADTEESAEILVAGIFIPNGMDERDARAELAGILGCNIANFDTTMMRAAEKANV